MKKKIELSKYNALEIADYVVKYSKTNQYNISINKLIRLLYLIQAKSLVEYKKVCFYNKILAWEFGPMVKQVYGAYANSFNLEHLVNQKQVVEIDKETKQIIEFIVEKYKNWLAFDMTILLHDKGVWKNYWIKKNQQEEIPVESILEYYSTIVGSEDIN